MTDAGRRWCTTCVTEGIPGVDTCTVCGASDLVDAYEMYLILGMRQMGVPDQAVEIMRGRDPVIADDDVIEVPSPTPSISLSVPKPVTFTPDEIEEHRQRQMRRAAAIDEANTASRRSAEARALEYATDVDGAIVIYEELVATHTYISVPYHRLAILYRKAKRWGDEERVVRLGIKHCMGGADARSWFVLRLAKIIGEQRSGKRRG